MSRFIVSIVVVLALTGCSAARVVIPPAPLPGAPIDERISWAERYMLRPGDMLGDGVVVRDLRDLRQGLNDQALNEHLERLSQPEADATTASLIALTGSVTALGSVVALQFLNGPKPDDDLAAGLVGLVAVGGSVAWLGGNLWMTDANARAEHVREEVRMMYSHLIEEKLDVEIRSDGGVEPRAKAVSSVIPGSL